jgi:two-component system chemotaxis response regulator CheB
MNRLIVVGASAGGVMALQELTAGLPEDLQAAVLIVLHVGAHRSVLPTLLAKRCPLPVAHAVDNEPIPVGEVRVAPPDHHLVVQNGVLMLNRGPKEHGSRPAIDPLFRTAALAYGPAVVGVVLTGMLDDGTPGLQAIKARGGTAIVQDPGDAFAPSMPSSALRFVEVDHCVPLALMPMLLGSLAAQPATAVASPPLDDDALEREQDVANGNGNVMETLSTFATPSPLACPECHGGLWKVLDSRPERYRCHTGHAYTLRTLQEAMATASDEAGWNALRALQERVIVLEHMESSYESFGDTAEAGRVASARSRLDRQVDVLRTLLEEGPEPVE